MLHSHLYRLAEWLSSCGVKTVAMQSTGIYWILLYDILEERGFEVSVVNARHIKTFRAEKVMRRKVGGREQSMQQEWQLAFNACKKP